MTGDDKQDGVSGGAGPQDELSPKLPAAAGAESGATSDGAKADGAKAASGLPSPVDQPPVPRPGDADYDASNLKHLSDLEHVRERPAMYIGDIGVRGLHHLVYEVVDNSIDEAMAGFARNISVTVNNDGSVTVEDDGRGIPVDRHEQLSQEMGRDVSARFNFIMERAGDVDEIDV